MRALGLLAAFLLGLGLVAAGAEELRVDREELRSDPSAPETLLFTVAVKKAGDYAIQLMVRAVEGREYTLLLTLQPEGSAAEDSSAAPSVRFTFTGKGCG